MKLALQIAIRFLKSAKTQTIVIILGIAVGVSVQVFIGSLIQGLQKDLVNTTIGSSSQITVKPSTRGDYIDNYSFYLLLLPSVDSNIESLNVAVDGAGSLIQDDQTEPILLRGFHIEDANQIYKFDNKLIEGTLPLTQNDVILGKDLFESFGLSLNDTITLSIPLGNSQTVKVVGVYDFKVSTINKTWVITTIPTAQSILGLNNQATSIEMQVKDVFLADETATNIITALNSDSLIVENWKDLNQDLLSGLNGQSISSLMIQVFVMISVVLGISSVLAITVMQKSKQIGILKAMGIKDIQASFVFLFEGLILGIFGAFFGVLFGLGLAYSFTTFALDANNEPIIALFIDPNFIALSALIAVFAATLASLIPARKSSKLSVIEVIRNG
ncbi:MAG TPA: ABC transporter permease [Bacilli bacterium]|nr:ABC transporter permease [Bacilli bacterium]